MFGMQHIEDVDRKINVNRYGVVAGLTAALEPDMELFRKLDGSVTHMEAYYKVGPILIHKILSYANGEPCASGGNEQVHR